MPTYWYPFWWWKRFEEGMSISSGQNNQVVGIFLSIDTRDLDHLLSFDSLAQFTLHLAEQWN